MSRRRRKTDDLNNLAAELGDEDGSNAVEFHSKPWDAPKRAGRKGQQLCGQVKDALHIALAGCADEVLQRLSVQSVEPAPHTGRLRVLVAAEDRTRDECGPCASNRVPSFRSRGGNLPSSCAGVTFRGIVSARLLERSSSPCSFTSRGGGRW